MAGERRGSAKEHQTLKYKKALRQFLCATSELFIFLPG